MAKVRFWPKADIRLDRYDWNIRELLGGQLAVKKLERQRVMGILGSALATLLTLALAIKYQGLGALSLIELAGMVTACVLVARKNFASMCAIAAYFGIVRAIPMVLSGNLVTIAMVAGVMYLLLQGVAGLSEMRSAQRPPKEFSESDKALMLEHGIEHNGRYYTAGDMHFDQLRDAVAMSTAMETAHPECPLLADSGRCIKGAQVGSIRC